VTSPQERIAPDYVGQMNGDDVRGAVSRSIRRNKAVRPTMMDWDVGWEAKPPQNATPRWRLERPRSELPRGGKDMMAQIGAELRAVFAPVPMSKLSGRDDLFARIDLWNDDIG
jgi:hypothetical protein